MTNRLVSQLGHSAQSPEIEKVFQEFGFTGRPYVEHHPNAGPFEHNVNKDGIYFNFCIYRTYEWKYGQPRSRFSKKYDELILHEISFDDPSKFPHPLPFDLAVGDSFEDICKKLGKKPDEKGKGEGYTWGDWYLEDDLCVFVNMDEEKELRWFRLHVMDESIREKLQLKAFMKEQGKAVNDRYAKELEGLKKKLPTTAWTKRMKEGDTQFAEQAIKSSEVILHTYIDQLLKAVQDKKLTSVRAALKKAVISFNKLNDQNEQVIETLEREELAAFLNHAVTLTGVQLKEGMDMTEEWREW